MSRLIDCLKGFNSIAVTGMCKNAGKTTVVNHLIEHYKSDFQVGLTSIGYDGEPKDEITRLEKPRIYVYPGMMVATCEQCLLNSAAGYVLFRATGIQTVIGEILVVRITSPGIMEVSGPCTVLGIERLCRGMREAGCQKIIVDGSAGRLSFASKLDCTILAVGAALSNSMAKVCKRAHYQVELLELDKCLKHLETKEMDDEPFTAIESDDGMFFVFRGAMADDDIVSIIKQYRTEAKTAVVKDSSSVFISPSIYRRFTHKSGNIRVRNKTNLVAVTINPMTPYGKWFDKDRFMDEMTDNLDLPVINIMDENI